MECFLSDIIVLLKHCKTPGGRFWKKASELLSFTEITGTCLGYSEKGTAGNAIGPNLRKQILSSIQGLERAGLEDPIIFELVGVFEEGIGCDRISDLLTYKLIDRVCNYTNRVMRECGYAGPVKEFRGLQLPASPYSEDAVLLLPRDILHPLPLAKRFEDIKVVCRENKRVRDNVNEWFDFSGGAAPTKRNVYEHMRDDTEFRDAFIDAYRTAKPETYDFGKDSVGEVDWYEAGKRFAEENPLHLPAVSHSKEGLESVVMEIVSQFKDCVENKGAWELLYDEDRNKPRKERTSQHLFSSIATTFCRANDVDISPEANSGNGTVDFKFSTGYSNKVLVELKLSKNPKLEHCLTKQIPTYMKQERTDSAICLLINVGNDKKVESFRQRHNELDSNVHQKIKLVVVDAKPKRSASKA